jgi:hypothetical protein
MVAAGLALLTIGGARIYAPLVWIIPGVVCVSWGILRERL